MNPRPLKQFEDIQHLLIVVAMKEEQEAILSHAQPKVGKVGNRTHVPTHEFDLPRCHITVIQSGIGPVNAATRCVLVAEDRPVDAVIMLGVGGALSENLSIGDTVIASQIMQHDSFSSLKTGLALMAPGQLTLTAKEQSDPLFKCDPVLCEWLHQTMQDHSEEKVVSGLLISGNEFVGTYERKLALRERFKEALMVDMETCGLAQVCLELSLPFAAAKTVADTLRPDESVSKEFLSFLNAAASHGRKLFDHLVRTFS